MVEGSNPCMKTDFTKFTMDRKVGGRSVNNPDQICTDGDDSPLDAFGDGPCFFEDVELAVITSKPE